VVSGDLVVGQLVSDARLKSLCPAVMIYDTLLNGQTHRCGLNSLYINPLGNLNSGHLPGERSSFEAKYEAK